MKLDQPAIAINPNVLLSSLNGGWRLEVFSKVGRALRRPPILLPVGFRFALNRPWLPAPDFVQLDVDARLDVFSHVSVRKGAAGAKSGLRVKGLENNTILDE